MDATTSTSSAAAASSSTSGQANNAAEEPPPEVEHLPRRVRRNRPLLSYLPLIGDVSSPSDARDDLWSCLVVLLTFWFFGTASSFSYLIWCIIVIVFIMKLYIFFSCVVILFMFWLVCFCCVIVISASMTLILGFYGSTTINLGPNASRIIHISSLFVQTIKVREKCIWA